MTNYYGKKVVVVGLGLSGFSCIEFFLTRGVVPRVMDTRNTLPWISKLPTQIEYHLGGLNDNWLLEADLIVVSPGISLTHPSLKTASNAGIEIVGDIEIFCREAQAPIVAITGSNGKSTVTSLVGEMAKTSNIKVAIGGNTGLPALTLLKSSYELYILELSSFQLETTFSLKAAASTILNIAEDHIDRYPFGFQQYCDAKLRIYKNAETCVINADEVLPIPKNCNYCVSFGVHTGDYYLDFCRGETWLNVKGEGKVLNATKCMRLSGQHNYINSLAALALSDIVGLSRTSSLEALMSFRGLPYRFEIVLERNGIRWINDSKSTNLSSTKAAINSLHIDGTLHLLLGGDGKSANFSSLKPYLERNEIRLYCFGRDRDKIASLYPEISEKTETMEQSMYLISSYVRPGDVVLLSPACASLDQFNSFKHRGDIFTSLANKLG